MKMTVDFWACREVNCGFYWIYGTYIKPWYAPVRLVRAGWYISDALKGFKLWT